MPRNPYKEGKHTVRPCLVAFSGLFVIIQLTGCNGGGLMHAVESPYSAVDWPVPESARSAVGGENLDMVSNQIRAKADGLRENADAVFVSDLFFPQPDGTTLSITPDCTGVICAVPGPGVLSLQDEVNFEYEPVMRRHRVDLVAARERVSGEMAADNVGYWGSLEFSGFGLGASQYDMRGADTSIPFPSAGHRRRIREPNSGRRPGPAS